MTDELSLGVMFAAVVFIGVVHLRGGEGVRSEEGGREEVRREGGREGGSEEGGR